jgi:hypothetical protein
MGLYVIIGWIIAVQDPKVKKQWLVRRHRHLELIRHFKVLKKSYSYNIFFTDAFKSNYEY